ncbi:response regulator [Aquibacillus salsiterrae]|uniref:Response regulator n=1 Tax=Aquibacillus salsiterrae TaxID=2950439 RepID=A0A9X3WES0_9BACI|nr:response regulator [Aquibacillus salsiterrae]MDC3416069.1 response regulator [Aquibacillus salsiterrae]
MQGKTILIVDDEPRSREGIKKTLDNWAEGKLNILTAASGHEAMERMNNNKINLLITDIRMPEITGLQLLEAMKKQNKLPVVIVISAYSEFQYAQEALRLGVVNYLLKPISKQELVEEVEKALKLDEKQERAGIIEQVVDEKLLDLNLDGRFVHKSIKEAISFVEENYAMELSLKEVANYVHLNPSYFSALFKEQTNLTFSEYLTRFRLQEAKRLLITTNKTVNEIAEDVGYKTTKYFIRLFKEYEQATPSSYRKQP